MIILAYIVATLSWPLVTFGSLPIFQFLMLPLFGLLSRPNRSPIDPEVARQIRNDPDLGLAVSLARTPFALPDVFLCVSLVGTQVLAVLAGKGIFRLFGCEATRGLAISFGIWCLVFAIIGGGAGGRLGRHFNLSGAIGLVAGWAVGTFWLL